MSQPHPELLIALVALVALALAPVASHLVRRIGEHVSAELDGGLTGKALNDRLDSAYELSDGSLRDDEIRQLLEAQAYLRGDTDPDIEAELQRVLAADGGSLAAEHAELLEEVRQIVIAANEQRVRAGEQPFDVEAESARRLAKLLGTNGHG